MPEEIDNHLMDFFSFCGGIAPDFSKVQGKIVSLCQELMRKSEFSFHYIWKLGDPSKMEASPNRFKLVEDLQKKKEAIWSVCEFDKICAHSITTLGDERTFVFALTRLFLNVSRPDFGNYYSTESHLLLSKLKLFAETDLAKKYLTQIVEIIGYANISTVMRNWADACEKSSVEYFEINSDEIELMGYCNKLGFKCSI